MFLSSFVKGDRTVVVEILSVISFIGMTIELAFGFSSPDTRSSIFWLLTMSSIGLLQACSIALRKQYPIFRMSMAFLAGTIWTFLGMTIINSVTAVPILCIGAFNVISFIMIGSRSDEALNKLFGRNRCPSTLEQN